MPDQNTQPTGESGKKMTRRDILALSAATGGVVAASSLASGSISGGSDGNLGIGGGPMSDEMSSSQARLYFAAENDLAEPNGSNRVVRITESGTQFDVDDYVVDKGDAWELMDFGVGSLSTEYVEIKRQPISIDSQRLVHVPTDYDTINEALNAEAGVLPRTDDVNPVRIVVESGHQPLNQVDCRGGYYGHITVESEDGEIVVDPDYNDGAFLEVAFSTFGPEWKPMIDMNHTGQRGVFVSGNATLQLSGVSGNAGVKNANRCLEVSHSAFVAAHGINVDNATGPSNLAVDIREGAAVNLEGSTISGGKTVVRDASRVNMEGATLRDTDGETLIVEGSNVDLSNSTITNCGVFRVYHGSRCNFENGSMTQIKEGEIGMLVRDSRLAGIDCEVIGAGSIGISYQSCATGSLRNAEVSGSTGDDIDVRRGSSVDATGCVTTNGEPDVGDTSVTAFNDLTSSGVVYVD